MYKVGENNIILNIKSLSKHFGALKAVDEVSFEVKRGEILGLIGPNGAGKTTITNLVTGTYLKNSGIFFGKITVLKAGCSHSSFYL